jgi:beta-galactosidase
LQAAAVGSAGLASWAILGRQSAAGSTLASGLAADAEVSTGQSAWSYDLTTGWRFGKWVDGAGAPSYDDSALPVVALPHGLTDLSWNGWEPTTWEDQWLYRRHFSVPQAADRMRLFLDFRGCMTATTPWLNGQPLPQHLGGYLPFQYEISDQVQHGDNVLAVDVDDRPIWQVPPQGSPSGTTAIDFYQPGGVYRPVHLRAVPQVYLSDVYAKPVNVLSGSRSLDVTCTVDAAVAVPESARLEVVLRDGKRVVARVKQAVDIPAGQTTVRLTLSDLASVQLWDVDAPVLYDAEVRLWINEQPVHDYAVRTGFRDARFAPDGFFLNGRRLKLFGLSRHQHYPFAGVAQPARAQRRDAEILRNELNCNIVRCSHYPQDDAFLDACDELGLLVWEEMPGWHYVGDQAWQDLAVRDVRDMVMRDRSRPSVAIWGVRVNEAPQNPDSAAFFARTTQAAKTLDDVRPTSGATDKHRTDAWSEDVFAFNDYSRNPDGTLAFQEPFSGIPYLITEAVGQYDYVAGTGFNQWYQRTGSADRQQRQANLHAQAHQVGGTDDRYAGVIGWCAFDYASGHGGVDNGVKYPGVCDMFRVPKLGASIYQAQVDPDKRPIIAPDFYWDFDPGLTPDGPGANAMVCSNCEQLEVYVAGVHRATVIPDAEHFGHLPYPPSFIDLTGDGSVLPELRIDGYRHGRQVISRSFSSDRTHDRLTLAADDPKIVADGSDATRVVFRIVDRYGAPRPYTGAGVTIIVDGPGLVVGDSPFALGSTGGVGAVWIRSQPGRAGRIQVMVSHPTFAAQRVSIQAVRPS